MLAISTVLHVVFLLALFIVKTEPKRVFLPPTYTTVELVSPPAGVERTVRKKVVKKRPVKKQVKKAVKKPPEKAVKKPVVLPKKVKKKPTKTAKKKPQAEKTPVKKQPVVDETLVVEKRIRAIEERVKEREAQEALEETIQMLERKRMLREEQRKRELEEIRAQLESFSRIVIRERSPQKGPQVSKTFELELMEYYNTIAGLIHSNWVYPEVEENNPEVILSITIGKDGRVLHIEVEKSSRDALFDSSAIRAVRKSAPFPKLPPQLGDTLEVGIRFCLKECV